MDYSLLQNWSNVKTLFQNNSQTKKPTLSGTQVFQTTTFGQGVELSISKQAWKYLIEKE